MLAHAETCRARFFCARFRSGGENLAPGPNGDMDLITYRGRVVAAVGFGGLHLVPELARRPPGDPELVFVAFMCAYALEVRLGRLPGPYDDETAALFARFAMIDEEEFRSRARWCDAALARAFACRWGRLPAGAATSGWRPGASGRPPGDGAIARRVHRGGESGRDRPVPTGRCRASGLLLVVGPA